MIRISLSREFNQPSRVAVKNCFVAGGKETRANSGTISRLGEWALYVSQANAEGWGNHITYCTVRKQTDGWARGDAGDGPAVGKIKLHASGFGSMLKAHHIQYCIPERAETA